MKWLLVYIALTGDRVDVNKMSVFNTMDECFDARDRLVEVIGRPIVNYQAVCVIQEDHQ
jgi:hypothetical protein